MWKMRPFLSNTFPKIHNYLNKMYSQSAQKFESALSLTDALGAKREIKVETVSTPNAVSPTSTEISTETASRLNVALTAAKTEEKAGDKCVTPAEKADPVTKKGKKCGQPKAAKTQKAGPPGGGYYGDKCSFYEKPRPNSKKWRTISYTLVPLAFGLSVLILSTREEPPEPEYIPYPSMFVRTRRFPWRDGRTSLFHGRNNVIPEEEEERLDREANEGPRYKKRIDEEDIKRKRREQHAKEELERRKKRHENEPAKSETT